MGQRTLPLPRLSTEQQTVVPVGTQPLQMDTLLDPFRIRRGAVNGEDPGELGRALVGDLGLGVLVVDVVLDEVAAKQISR